VHDDLQLLLRHPGNGTPAGSGLATPRRPRVRCADLPAQRKRASTTTPPPGRVFGASR
jgi:hypothetical protein